MNRQRYLLIGGYAVSIHSKPRLDRRVGGHLPRVALAPEDVGAPSQAIADVQSCPPDEIVWFGRQPARVDILKSVPGVEFPGAGY
jgi:hypothetical protein